MIATALQNLRAHTTRLALTAMSIVLGVSFLTGTLIYRDMTRVALEHLLTDAYAGIDVVVAGAETSNQRGRTVLFDESLVDQIEVLDGVAAATPTLSAAAVQLVVNGEPLIEGNLSSQVGTYLPPDQAAQGAVTLRSGRAPTTASDIVIDVGSAADAAIAIGDEVEVVSPTTLARPFTVVGVAVLADNGATDGSTVFFDLPTTQELIGKPGQIDGVLVLAEPEKSVGVLIEEIADVVGDTASVLTASSAATEEASELQEGLSFLHTLLPAFAWIALFVSTFIISNTFRVILTQRTRELALLRALGGSRAQVLAMVLAEAITVGVAASIVGVAAGIAVAYGIQAGLSALGMLLPTGGLVVTSGTVVPAFIVGVAATVVSALFPAIAASRVPPLAAMRPDAAAGSPHRFRLRLIVGGAIVLGGGAAVAAGLVPDVPPSPARAAFVGPGVAAVLIGLLIVGAPLARLVVPLVGWPFGFFGGTAGRLARGNSARNPRRAAATTAAIVIAGSLVALTNVVAASFSGAVDNVLDQGIEADFIATSADPFSLSGFSPEVTDQILDLAPFESATRLQLGTVVIDGEQDVLGGIDDHFSSFITLDDVVGNLDLGPGEMLSVGGFGTDTRSIGDDIRVEFDDGSIGEFTVTASAEGRGLTGLFVSRRSFTAFVKPTIDQQVFLRLAPGFDHAQASDALATIDDAFPAVSVQTTDELQALAESQVKRIVGLVTALLGLSVLIALIGVANTITLTVHERTREIGLLRVIGLSRRETGRMVMSEASILALYGGTVGTAFGIFSAWALLKAMAEAGFTVFVVPIPEMAAALLVLGLVATLFAAWPGRVAARLDVLSALTEARR